MNSTLSDLMVLLPNALAGNPHPNAPIISTAIPVAVDPFPTSAYPDLFETSSASATKLNNALNAAVTAAGGSGLMGNISTMAFLIADLNSGPQFPMGGYHETEVDFIASEAKVAVMYAAFELRSMARRFMAANSFIQNADFFKVLDSVQTPKFLNFVPQITSAMMAGSRDARKPDYPSLFTTTAKPDGTVASVDFNSSFTNPLTQMVVMSDDPSSTTCIHAVGFSYLNGALKAGGFFTGSGATSNGVWVGSDYSNGASGWPTLRVVKSENDGMATITGTCRQMAKIMALIFTGQLVDKGTSSAADNGAAGSCAEMKKLVSDAAQRLCVLTSPSIPQSNFVLNKVGYAFKGLTPGNGVINSQLSVIKDVAATGHTYLITWQNLVTPNEPCGISSDPNTAKVIQVIGNAITAYEKP
jgi:hypothetical protein